MSILGKRLKEARENKRLTQIEASKKLGISNGTLSGYERNYRDPDTSILEKMAELYEVQIDWLLGRTDKKEPELNSQLPELTEKDEKDIAKELERMINNLSNNEAYASFDGVTLDEMDEEDRELLIASLENSLRLAKRMAKQKFTPKKYRKRDKNE